MIKVCSLKSPQIIQKLSPAGQWQGVSYAQSIPEADNKLSQLRRFHSGRFRIVPSAKG